MYYKTLLYKDVTYAISRISHWTDTYDKQNKKHNIINQSVFLFLYNQSPDAVRPMTL